jgi:putative ABC transport system permease protein
MRDVAVDSSGRSVGRVVFGTLAGIAGGLLLVAGLNGSAPGFALGALAMLTAVVALGPVLATRFTRLIGAPVATLRGMTGVLARDNASRNPKRTAATASSLMIGVALVVLITVFAASARTSINANIDDNLRSDWLVVSVQQQGGLSTDLATRLEALPEIGSVTGMRYTGAALEGTSIQVAGVDPAVLDEHLDAGVVDGSLADLGDHGLGVHERTATEHGWHLGDEIVIEFAETGPQHFTLAMVHTLRDPLGDYVVSHRAFEANVAQPHDDFVMATNAPGTTSHAARAAIEGVLADFPSGTLHTPGEFKESIAGEIDRMLNLIYVLLVLAVVIALFGIANTLALSVVERTRELGLLRAVGMQRSQVRAAVRWEAVLIALLGTALGTALGLGFGWVLVQALADEGIGVLAVPVARLGVIVAVAALAAVAAAALPARRAARLDVLDAIAG